MLMPKVTLLEKKNGVWSQGEISALVRAGVEVEGLNSMPGRLVAVTELQSGQTFQRVLGHSDFTVREVDYQDRWS